MRISVIIPVLNEADNLPRAIASVQTADEIICVDGGSEDASLSVIEQCGAIACKSSRGRGTQLNAGARRASGELLLFLHADNWLADGALARLRKVGGQRGRELGGFTQRIDADAPVYRALEAGNAFRARAFGMLYGDQAIWVRRERFEQLGGFADIPLMEDVEFMRQARKIASPALLRGPVHVSARRWQSTGVVRQTLRNWRLLAAYQRGVASELLAERYEADHK